MTSVPAPLCGSHVADGGTAPESPAVGRALGRRRPTRWWEDAAASASHPWWDDAPVPPPVVVASADRRTPAVTFAPDADPFSAGGVFAPQGGRDGEPPVVVHQAPDAAVRRSARRARSAGAAAATVAEVLGSRGLGERDAGSDAGSLVRPYVAQFQPCEPGDQAVAAPPSRTPRRGRRSGGPLDRIIDTSAQVPTFTPAPTAPVGEWSAPWMADAEPAPAGRPAGSLFEPATPSRPSPWTPPLQQPLPTRKALRARERAGGSNPAPSAKARAGETGVTGRRLAKSGVLAVTAVGVVAASAPNAFSALGWRLPQANSGAQAALAGLAGSGAIPAPNVSLSGPIGATRQLVAEVPDDAYQATKRNVAEATRRRAAATARAGAVATGAGRTLVDVAREQVLAEAERKAAIAQQVSRNAVRDPRSYARLLLQERGWSDQFTCLNLLWDRESGWNYQAYNPSSGAYGIPQALPGSKMASIAADWRTNPATQIRWGLNYIAERYVTPCGAWGHSQATGWY
ncbi:MAG: aggregation-promoting factor C-terminal-like domain-containing protein [Kineosporiaceae bacterium]